MDTFVASSNSFFKNFLMTLKARFLNAISVAPPISKSGKQFLAENPSIGDKIIDDVIYKIRITEKKSTDGKPAVEKK